MAKADIGQKKREENAARWRAWHRKNRDEYNLRRRIATKARGQKDARVSSPGKTAAAPKPAPKPTTATSPVAFFAPARRHQPAPPSPLFSVLRVIPPPPLAVVTTPLPVFWTSTYQPVSPLGSNIGFAWKQEAHRALSSALSQSL